MNYLDAFTLARTKQQTRRVRRLLVGVVCALLFAVLLTGSFLAAGIGNSASRLKEYGYNKQYLTVAIANFQNASLENVKTAVQEDMDTELRARKIIVTDTVRQGESYQTEASRRMNVRLSEQSQANNEAFIAKTQRTYKPTAVYQYKEVETMNNADGVTADDSDPLLTRQMDQVMNRETSAAGRDKWHPPVVRRVDQALITSALQPGQSFGWEPGQPYPIVVPYASLPRMADKSLEGISATEQMALYKRLISRYTGTLLTYCYRNPAAQAQLMATLQYNKGAQTDKDPKTNPIPITACQPLDQHTLQLAGIVADPQDQAVAKPLFTHEENSPVTQTVQFKIVGFIPTSSYGDHQSKVASIIANVNNWGFYVSPGIIPQQVYERSPFLSSDKTNIGIGAGNDATTFFQFANRAEQKRFIDSGCQGIACMQSGAWTIVNFGNVIVSFEKMTHIVGLVLLWAAVVVGIIAAILMMSTISKLVADSRKEIAIFQALGARASDIVQIYVSYGLLLAVNTLVGALALSVAASLYVSHAYSASVGVMFAVSVGVFDQSLEVSLFGLQISWILLIAAVLVLATLAGVGLALLFSGGRNVMEHMKDE